MAKAKEDKQNRFSTLEFMRAWKVEGMAAKNWDDFVLRMQKQSGDPEYSESRILERMAAFRKELKTAGLTKHIPKSPKKRVAASVSAIRRLGWLD